MKKEKSEQGKDQKVGTALTSLNQTYLKGIKLRRHNILYISQLSRKFANLYIFSHSSNRSPNVPNK